MAYLVSNKTAQHRSVLNAVFPSRSFSSNFQQLVPLLLGGFVASFSPFQVRGRTVRSCRQEHQFISSCKLTTANSSSLISSPKNPSLTVASGALWILVKARFTSPKVNVEAAFGARPSTPLKSTEAKSPHSKMW